MGDAFTFFNSIYNNYPIILDCEISNNIHLFGTIIQNDIAIVKVYHFEMVVFLSLMEILFHNTACGTTRTKTNQYETKRDRKGHDIGY